MVKRKEEIGLGIGFCFGEIDDELPNLKEYKIIGLSLDDSESEVYRTTELYR